MPGPHEDRRIYPGGHRLRSGRRHDRHPRLPASGDRL